MFEVIYQNELEYRTYPQNQTKQILQIHKQEDLWQHPHNTTPITELNIIDAIVYNVG